VLCLRKNLDIARHYRDAARHGEVRMTALADAGAMRQFVRFARATGLPLNSILDDELAAIAAASETADRIPAHGIIDMLQVCAVVSGRGDLGVALAAWGNMRGYGPISQMYDHCPTLAEAFRINQHYVHRESAALRSVVEDDGDEIAIRHIVCIPARYGASQFIEATLTLELRVGRILLGEDWSPLRLELEHPAPADTSYQRMVLRCPIEYGADRSAMVIARADLLRPSRTGNPHMLSYLERHIWNAELARPIDLVSQAEQVIAARLAGGRVNLAAVAQALAVSPRTLQRKLTARGLTFALVVDTVRRRAATEYFNNEVRPNLTQLAHRLGFGDASAASRYLRTQMDTGVRALRRRALREVPPS
jgi:AraC-like DNA-binding protein